MARPRQAQTVTPAPAPPSSTNGAEPYDDDQDDDRELTSEDEAESIFAELRKENGTAPKATVKRVDPVTGKQTWLGEIASDQATQEYVATRWGGGKYFLKHKVAKPTGGWRYAFHQTFEIDPSVKPQAPEPAAPSSGAALLLGGAPADPSKMTTDQLMQAGIMGLFTQMQNLNALTLSFAERIAKASDQPRTSLVDQLVPFVPVFQEMVRARSGGSDPTELAVKLAGLMKRDNVGLGDVMTIVKQVLEMSGKGPPSEGDSTLAVVREGIGTLGKAVDAFAANAESRRQPPTGMVGHPVRVVDASPSPSSQPSTPSASVSDRPWVAEARPHLPLLLANAHAVPAEAAALMIEKNLSDVGWDDFITDLKTEGFESRLVTSFPAASAVSAEWFGQVRTTLLEWVAQAERDQAANQPRATTGG
jgi:hypothetical protein